MQGGVSGGCLENDVRALALEVLRGGASRMLHYDTGSDEETLWGLGLGCEGAVDVYLQRIGTGWVDAAGKQMRELAAAGMPFAAITIVRGPFEGKTLMLARGSLIGSSGAPELDRDLAQRAGPLLEGDGGSALLEISDHAAFVDVLRPPPRLLIFGAGDDARPLAAIAADAGFEVTVVDHRPAYLNAERFRKLLENAGYADWTPDGKTLVATHRPGNDDQLEWPAGTVILRTQGYFSHLRVSPDGQSAAFLDHPIYGDNRGGVAVCDRSGKKRTLTRDWAVVEGLAWSPDGSEVWFTGLNRAEHYLSNCRW